MNKIWYYINQLKAEIAYLPMTLGYLFSSKKKAIYIGCTGQGNLGDEVILCAINAMLSSNFFLYQISYQKPSSGKYLRKFIVKNPDYILLGGGTIIRKKATESYLKILIDSKKCWPNAKIATLGPGVAEPYFADYIGFPMDVRGWKSLLEQAIFVSVRGIRSKQILESWEIGKKVNIFHDPAIWFTRKHFITKSKQKKIGLNFADIGDRIFGRDKEVIKKFALNFVFELQKQGWQIYLYPTTSSDLQYMLQAIGLGESSNIHIYSNYRNHKESLDFLESMDVFLGQRLHSIIFAATVGTPFYALEYEPKTSDFLETLNLLDHSCQIDQIKVDLVLERIKNIYRNLDKEQEILRQKITEAKEDQLRCLDLFLKETRL